MDAAGEQPLCVKEFYDERTGKWEFKNWDGCFAAGTPVWVASVAAPEIQARSASECIRAAGQHPSAENAPALLGATTSANAVAEATGWRGRTAQRKPPSAEPELLLPIESVPLGSRVSTLSPDDDYDFSLPEPQADSWRRIALTIHRHDGATVEIELLRPAEWVARNGLTVGGLHFTHIDELEFRGFARVTAIEACPPLAAGDGAVVTGRYLTRGAGKLVRVELEDGDDLVGTAQHPVWSESRHAWTPLGELLPGEQLRSRAGPLAVLAVVPLPGLADVYNLEIHGQHVYDVTAAGVLVHNATPCLNAQSWQEYENGVRNLYRDTPISSRRYRTIVDGKPVEGIADDVASIEGRNVAIEAKYVGPEGWARSIRNPHSPIGSKPFAIAEQAKMLAQARKYSAAFDDVIYHSNCAELIAHYSNVFRSAGITNFQFILTP